MMKKLLLGVASSFLLMGAANAETIIVDDGGDDGGIASNPAPAFSAPGFFGGSLGDTDVASPDNFVAHRFTGLMTGATGGTLIIQIAQSFGGSNNDVIRAGNADSGATAGAALANVTSFGMVMGNTITIDLATAGLLSIIQANGFLDVLVGDDREIDFIQLDVEGIVPVPAALPLMASALIGGAAAMRRRKKA
ncbi:MAG: PEP-CTERM sorting domain-containing protein [Pseudomonadota bacterium]